MADVSNNDKWFSQLENHLRCSEQNWLLGAGISYDAKLPLMYPLTSKVTSEIENASPQAFQKIIKPLIDELPVEFHIEHILSHLGDYTALAERAKSKAASINGQSVTLAELETIHEDILSRIAQTIRFGYVQASEDSEALQGTLEEPIVCVASHADFIDVLFNHAQAGIAERMKPTNIFTTNYDTLLEDAMALNRIDYWDGFSGGAVAYRTLKYGESLPQSGFRANLIKMHGSIDWYLCEKTTFGVLETTIVTPTNKNECSFIPKQQNI
ncbi:MAG: hypothetical protein ACI8WB_004099 [Phenylobacterium sp.]|jgi:hypothetical protein